MQGVLDRRFGLVLGGPLLAAGGLAHPGLALLRRLSDRRGTLLGVVEGWLGAYIPGVVAVAVTADGRLVLREADRVDRRLSPARQGRLL